MKTATQLTDNQLVQSFQQGNNQALEVLISRYKDKIFTSILFLVKDKYLAEDLFQDTFIKIIDSLRADRYNDEGKFLPWALRVAHNLCIDHFRKVNKVTTITSDDKDIFEVLNFEETTAEQAIMKGQNNALIRQVIDALPREQREVIVLRHFGDMSFKEIAATTNCSINTALGRMRYALMNMRKMIEENQLALQ